MVKLTQKQKESVNALFSDNALRMMKKRYLVVDDKGVQETPADMFNRVASALAEVEREYGKKDKEIQKIAQEFFEIMGRKEFTPAGRTLTNAGSSTPLIANCVVLPIHDSMESIFQTLKDAALLQQAGCGIGFDFSELRPANSPTKKSRGVASGPVSFLRAYDAAFATIKQQCFAKGTRIVTQRGLVPIQEVRIGDKTYTEKGWKKVTEVFSNGVRETVKLTLDSGFEIELTLNHKVAVVQEGTIALKEVRELSKDDVLLMKLGGAQDNSGLASLRAVPYALHEQLAYFLGLYHADGWNDGQGFGFCIPDSDRIEAFAKNLIQNLFGVGALTRKTEGENCRKIKVNSLWAKEYLRANGLLKKHSWEVQIPEAILRSPANAQMAFVAGFFDGDGDNGKNYRLNTTSKIFAQQLQLLLLNNSIGAKIKEEQRHTNWRVLHRVCIIGKDSTHRFYEKLSSHSWKIQKKKETKDFGWIFPFNPMRDLGYSWNDIRGLHDGMRSTISHSILSRIQGNAVLQQAEAIVQEKVDWTGFLPVRIQSVTPAGMQEVYDFEVEDVHMINAGLYTKNSRHGANMSMMRVDHPDVLDFIECKKAEGEIRNFNISITVTDEFMEAVEKTPNKQWYCSFKGVKTKPHRVLRHANGAVYGSEEVDVTAKDIFDKLVEAAWTNGEPGIAFVDTWNKTNPLPGLGPLACTNPCGEQTLHPYDNCNLSSINLAVFVKNRQIDFKRLKTVVRAAVRLTDNVIDRFDYPVSQVTEMAKKNRRIGLGIMGFADMLYQLGVRYDSKRGFAVAEKVMGFINTEAGRISRELAEEKGVFPNIALSVYAKKKIKTRNAALTTVAPTGSISMMMDASSGIEPNFALAYVKQDKDGHQYRYFNRYLEDALKKLKLSEKEREEIMKDVIEKGTIQHIEKLPKALRDIFVISMDIAGEAHMRMQAAFQKNVDNSISKTVNFPNSATREEVASVFISAWKLGCKSCTVYRDGSRVIQVLNVGTGGNIIAPTESLSSGKSAPAQRQASSEPELKIDEKRLAPRVRPQVMSGKTYKMKTGYGNLYITINNDEKAQPFEVFATIGKSGGFFQEQSEAICKLVSRGLRGGIAPQEIIDDLKGIRGPMPVFTDKGTILSLPDAIGKVLEEHVGASVLVEEIISRPENQEVLPFVKEAPSVADFGFMPGCPDCGSPLQMQEGCIACKSCGFSRCS